MRNILKSQDIKIDDYYTLRVAIAESANGWTARTRLHRNDTCEEVSTWGTYHGSSLEELENAVSVGLTERKKLLSPPDDWESLSRPVLIDYLKLRDMVTAYGQKVWDEAVLRQDLGSEFPDFHQALIRQTVVIVEKLASLSNDDRLAILLSPPSVLETPHDPWSLDDMTARLELFRFIASPSAEETAQHRRQESAIESSMKLLAR